MDQQSLADAVTLIDGEFGKGYAVVNPSLVAVVLQAAAQQALAGATLKAADATTKAVEIQGELVLAGLKEAKAINVSAIKEYGAISNEALKTSLDETLAAYAGVFDNLLKQAVVSINSALTHVESLR
jgi:hypothetical protein